RSSATPNSDSGGAALMVTARWERARGLPQPDAVPPVTARVAVVPLTALVVTGLAALLTAVLT
ncbi:MAG: hypothetical protein ACOYXW_15785, partial [Actinomycetota bacterium]